MKANSKPHRYQSSREIFQDYIPGFENRKEFRDNLEWNPASNGIEAADLLVEQFKHLIKSEK